MSKTRLSTWKQSKRSKAAQLRSLERLQNLSNPITLDDIASFTKCLVAIPFDGDTECWFYVGCRQATTEGLRFKLGAYANRKFHGEVVGPHQFALASSEGITLADLAGCDVHHSAKFGQCVGYRCCNPDHLLMIDHRVHARVHADPQTRKTEAAKVAESHVQQVESVVLVPPVDRGPEELRAVTRAGRRRRSLAGVPFLIRLGQMEGLEA